MPENTNLPLLWCILDDDWRDLTAEVDALPGGAATIMTGSGTYHLLSTGFRVRVPGGHAMGRDRSLIRVDTQTITPCGAVWWEPPGITFHCSSQIVAVWIGTPQEGDPPPGRALGPRLVAAAADLGEGEHLHPAGHPDAPCGALLCPALGEDIGNVNVALRNPFLRRLPDELA